MGVAHQATPLQRSFVLVLLVPVWAFHMAHRSKVGAKQISISALHGGTRLLRDTALAGGNEGLLEVEGKRGW